MADQSSDFNIKVVTTADQTGIQQTSAGFDKLKQQQATFAETARRQAAAAASVPTPVAAGGITGGAGGLTGTAIGVGTIVTLLTTAINKWREFNAEQDRWVDGMIKAEATTRALGESILDMQDKARSAARIGIEPLEISFARLTQDVARLKTEMALAFEAGEFEDWKKLNAELSTAQSQLNGVTSALQREADAAKKAAQSELEKRVPGLKTGDQVKEADAQTKAILMNEQAAAKARAEGRDADADMFDKSAEGYKKSATPAQLADLQRIHDLQDKLKGPAAPTYQPLNPDEFARQSEAAREQSGGGFSSEEMRQHQLDNQAARYKGVQDTRRESDTAHNETAKAIQDLKIWMQTVWGN